MAFCLILLTLSSELFNGDFVTFFKEILSKGVEKVSGSEYPFLLVKK